MPEIALTDNERAGLLQAISLSPAAVRFDQIDRSMEGGFAFYVGECRGHNETMHQIAQRHGGFHKGQLRMWINADPMRVAAYEAGVAEVIEDGVFEAWAKNREILDIADDDALDNFKANRRMSGRNDFLKNTVTLAGKIDSKRWGAKPDGGGNGGITVIVNRAGTEPPVVADGGRTITV